MSQMNLMSHFDLRYLRHYVVSCLLLTAFMLPSATAQGLPSGASQGAPVQYVDVPAGHWAAEAIAQLTELGIITGYPDGTFGGTRPLNRYEVAVIAVRILNYVDAVVAANEMGMSPEGAEDMQQAALDMEMVADFDTRISMLENALEQAASVAFVAQLEARVANLEAEVNAMTAQGTGMDTDMDTDMDAAEMADADAMQDVSDADIGVVVEDADEDASMTDMDTDDGDMMDDMTVSADSGFSGELAEILPDGTDPSEEHPLFFGVAPGLLSTDGIYLGLYAGYDDLFGPVSVMARMILDTVNEEVRITGSAIYRFTLDVVPDPVQLYAGVGTGISFRSDDSAFVFEFPIGAEYYITPRLGLFAQVTPTYSIEPIDEFNSDISLGLNVRF